MTSLSPAAARGSRWGAARGVVFQVSNLVVIGLLTRLVDPSDFGLVATALIVTGFVDLITRVGFGAAVVNAPEMDRLAISSLFYGSLLIGSVAASIAALSAGWLAGAFGQPEAAALITASVLVVPLNMARGVVLAVGHRKLLFEKTALVEIIGSFVYGLAAVGLALAGFGAWALVMGKLVQAGSMLLLGMIVLRWAPLLGFKYEAITRQLRFSGGWWLTELGSYLKRNADYWVVSRFIGQAALGAYYVAYVAPTLTRQRITQIGTEILFPVLSVMQEQPARALEALRRALRIVATAAFPVLLGLAVLADLAVPIAFGAGWDEAIQPFRILSINAAFSTVGALAATVMPAQGRPWMNLIGILTGFATFAGASIFLLPAYAVSGVAIALTLGTLASVLVNLKLASTALETSVWGIGSVIFYPLVASLLMAIGTIVFRAATPLEGVAEAFAATAFGATVWLISMRLLFPSAMRAALADMRLIAKPSRGEKLS